MENNTRADGVCRSRCHPVLVPSQGSRNPTPSPAHRPLLVLDAFLLEVSSPENGPLRQGTGRLVRQSLPAASSPSPMFYALGVGKDPGTQPAGGSERFGQGFTKTPVSCISSEQIKSPHPWNPFPGDTEHRLLALLLPSAVLVCQEPLETQPCRGKTTWRGLSEQPRAGRGSGIRAKAPALLHVGCLAGSPPSRPGAGGLSLIFAEGLPFHLEP